MTPAARWRQWMQRFDALSLRERVLVALALLVALVMAWQWLLMDPLSARADRLHGELDAAQRQLAALEEQQQALLARSRQDPDRETRAALQAVRADIDTLDRELTARLSGLIEPAQMARVLEDLLVRQQRLRLLRVESEAAEPLVEAAADAGGRAAGVYRHGLVLEFEGDYLGTLAYLQALQAMPWDLYWDGVELAVERHPRARVVLRVHTLSLSEGWIGV